MKTKIILFFSLLITVFSFAQQSINYKAILKDTNGNVLANTYMTVQFSIHQSTSNGTIVYQEDHNYTTDTNGLIVLNIGTDTTPLLGNFNAIDWSTHIHFLQTSITYSGGTIDFDATEFLAVPYAKHAETAANVFSGDYNDLTNQPTTLPTGLERITESTDTDTGEPIYGWRLVGSDPANHENIGENAVDLSFQPDSTSPGGASGRYSTAIGFDLQALGDYSTALGARTAANEIGATAIGANTSASGEYSTAIGHFTVASGDLSTAMGYFTTASGDNSTAMGYDTEASGNYSTAMGRGTEALGNYSTAMGYGTDAQSYAETVIGRYNTYYAPNSTTGWDDGDRLFVIGNGTPTAYSNALTVFKNGNVDLGGSLTIENESDANSSWRLETRPNGSLSMYRNGSYRGFFSESTGNYSSISDRSTKRDITPLDDGTLNKVMQLNPVSYIMKEQTDSKRNLGLISQEVQEIFPSITNYVEEADLITLSYTELIPILIKALQEQQVIIDKQQATIEAQNTKDKIQDKSIETLITRLNLLESKSSN